MYILKKFATLLTTATAALGLFFAGTVSANASSTYTVKSGDSVWAISQKYNTSINSIEKANNIKGHLIIPGQKLTIGKKAATATPKPIKKTVAKKAASTQTATTTKTASTSSTTSTYTGSNLKSYVLSQMESRTGVSASTWNTIITRESNWQPTVRNSTSGAYGLFQNMHISSGSVEEQVDAAVSLFNAQGMAAWAL
ncbi:extracellular protein [Pediococcus cellicola]|uniref:Extracellular protein n=1 Tax=Pediococcus cellicola TaxID=319652 RepID=A0A0R2IPJ8_9LACO|nr:extracellular protein [Pediococcus cellicola]